MFWDSASSWSSSSSCSPTGSSATGRRSGRPSSGSARRKPDGRERGVPFFRVEKLVKYFGGLAAVNDVSFEVSPGEIFGLIGPNGSGKTTTFNMISGYHRPTSGRVIFKGREIHRLPTYRICRLGIGRTFQVVKPLGRMTVLHNVTAAAFCRVNTMREARGLAEEAE